jgi:hypothetical protein
VKINLNRGRSELTPDGRGFNPSTRIISAAYVSIALLAIAMDYPSFYVVLHHGYRSAFQGVLITQYSSWMTSILIAILLVVVSSAYFLRRKVKKDPAIFNPPSVRLVYSSLSLAALLATLMNYPTYYVLFNNGFTAFWSGIEVTQYSLRMTAILLLLLLVLAFGLLRGVMGLESKRHESPTGYQLSDADRIRIRMWQARSGYSRPIGFGMFILCAVFFALSYSTLFLGFEIASIAAFLVGSGLFLGQLEPRAKLYPMAESALGPLMATSMFGRKALGDFRAHFIPAKDEGAMNLVSADTKNSVQVPSTGEGIYQALERELGELGGRGLEYAGVWIPRALVQGMNLADKVLISASDGEITTVMVKPYVRSLCVREEMTENVCGTMGCPLVAAIGQVLAQTTGKEISHVRCTYNPARQVATAVHKEERGK